MPENPTFEAITTEEQFNARVAPLLQAERDKYKDYETLKADAGKVAGLQTQVSKLDTQIKTLQNDALKRRIAHEVGLPWDLADRLSGADEKALRTDAQTLAKLIRPATPPAPPLADPETPPANTADAALKQTLAQLDKED